MPITVYGLTLQSPLDTRTTDMLTKLVYYFWASTEEFNTSDQRENIEQCFIMIRRKI